jgi:hypothetical protein
MAMIWECINFSKYQVILDFNESREVVDFVNAGNFGNFTSVQNVLDYAETLESSELDILLASFQEAGFNDLQILLISRFWELRKLTNQIQDGDSFIDSNLTGTIRKINEQGAITIVGCSFTDFNEVLNKENLIFINCVLDGVTLPETARTSKCTISQNELSEEERTDFFRDNEFKNLTVIQKHEELV